ncbi:MAG: hypothetical protein LBC07_04110 [Elusimicrobiota bacterium]|jgi:hypothetical protein|nr:hypothetical protein [Elusimicrobiota bacterium]
MKIAFLQNAIDFLRRNKEIKKMKHENEACKERLSKFEFWLDEAKGKIINLDLLGIAKTLSLLSDDFSKDMLCRVIKYRSIYVWQALEDIRKKMSAQFPVYKNKKESMPLGKDVLYCYSFDGGGGVLMALYGIGQRR